VIEIVVAVGDTVAVEDTLIVVESEKATVEIPSPQAGTVTALKVAVGDSINTGDPLLELEATQDAVDESSEPSEPSEPVQEQEVQAPSGAVPVGDKEKTYKSTP